MSNGFTSSGEGAARCANSEIAACNWQAEHDELCASCVLTRTRPAANDPEGLAAFPAAEAAKGRLLFEIIDMRLPISSWQERPRRARVRPPL